MTASRPPASAASQALSRPRCRAAELVVDMDAQRLERARRRMLVALAVADRLRDEVGELARRRQRMPLPSPRRWRARCVGSSSPRPTATTHRQSPPHRPRPAIPPQGFPGVGSMRMSSGPSGLETEPARGIVQLRRRNAEIEQHAIQAAGRLLPFGKIREVRVPDGDARISHRTPSPHPRSPPDRGPSTRAGRSGRASPAPRAHDHRVRTCRRGRFHP